MRILLQFIRCMNPGRGCTRLALAAAICLPLVVCAAESGSRLTLTGSSTVAPLMAEIARAYENAHAGVRVDVQSGGSSRGIADARSGLADIGMASRALRSEENDLHAFTIARDGIAIILHTDNPVSELSNAQIKRIYTGELRNWKRVGGKDAPITVIHKAEGRSTLELFLAYFELTPAQVNASVVIGDNQQGIKTLSGNPDGIGYVSIGTAEYEAGAGTAIKILALNGIAASTETVRDGSFPLSRPLNLVTRARPRGLQKKFIEFAQSQAAHPAIKELSFVPVQ